MIATRHTRGSKRPKSNRQSPGLPTGATTAPRGLSFAGLLWPSILALLADPQTAQPELPSYGAQLVQTLIALVLVCILAYVVLRWGLARFIAPASRQGPMEVLSRLPMEGRQSLVVVRVGHRVFLMALGNSTPQMITELDPERWERTMEEWDQKRPPSLFQRILQGKDQTRTTPAAGPEPHDESPDQGEPGPREPLLNEERED